ncbi:DM13 domain-containing protein [uncultured Jatrophihabitans sp.]|uniref:DM13 domain-containing protein n=1 Tax=uncultured Jatrophihabitans sp. TaxID=1610747 RepID=UPI0035CC8FC5
MPPRRRTRRLWLAAVAFVVAAGVTFGLVWFQPWKLFIDHRVDEQLPQVAIESPAAVDSTVAPSPSVTAPSSPSASSRPTAALLSRGTLISHEHPTSGTVSVVRQPDGSRVLAIANLDTSDGPDVHVWLTDAPVLKGDKGWHVFDDGQHISLGTLKANLGNQVYRIPKGADLTRLTSVSIWCERFDVSFGAAQLKPAA